MDGHVLYEPVFKLFSPSASPLRRGKLDAVRNMGIQLGTCLKCGYILGGLDTAFQPESIPHSQVNCVCQVDNVPEAHSFTHVIT